MAPISVASSSCLFLALFLVRRFQEKTKEKNKKRRGVRYVFLLVTEGSWFCQLLLKLHDVIGCILHPQRHLRSYPSHKFQDSSLIYLLKQFLSTAYCSWRLNLLCFQRGLKWLCLLSSNYHSFCLSHGLNVYQEST